MIFAESEKALLIRAVHSFPLFLALGKIIQRVNKCPRAGHKNIWMIAATHRRTAIFAQTHCHFSKRVHAAGNGINGILLKFRLSPHYLGYDIEQGINRPHAKARAAFFNAIHIHEYGSSRRHAAGIGTRHRNMA